MTSSVARTDDLRALLRKLTPKQRLVLRELPKHAFQFWRTVEQCGVSTASAHAWMRRPEFVAARTAIEEQALDEIGATTHYVLSKTKEVVDRCMQEVAPVIVRGEHVETETPDGELAKAYMFNAKDALAGLKMLGQHRRLWNEDSAKLQAPEGPGLTVIVQQGGAQVGVHAQAGAAGRVVVDLPGPER